MVIGITPRLIACEDYFELREAWDLKWGQLIFEMGYFPVFLSVSYAQNHLEQLGLDGVILSGGNDLNVLRPNDLSALRDDFEKGVVRYAIDNNIPILGVCRGMQFLAKYFGEELIDVDGHIASNHKVHFYGSERLALGAQVIDVNSFHAWGLNRIQGDWDVLGKCDDSTIEVMLHQKYKILAHMWHLEREIPFNPFHIKMTKQFFEHLR